MPKMYIGFPLDSELEGRVIEVVKDIQTSEDKRQYALKIFQVVNDLTNVGLDYFFVQSLKKAKIGKIKMIAVEQATNIGRRAVMTIGKSLVKSLSDEQLLVIANVLEESILTRPNTEA
jgi:phosphoribosyl-dephospho-CoA transferase